MCFPSMRYDFSHMAACSGKFKKKRVVCLTALHDEPYQEPSSENCTNTCWLCLASPFFSQIRLMAASLKWCSPKWSEVQRMAKVSRDRKVVWVPFLMIVEVTGRSLRTEVKLHTGGPAFSLAGPQKYDCCLHNCHLPKHSSGGQTHTLSQWSFYTGTAHRV